MTAPSDDYLAQLDRALERLEATSVDTELAAEAAPHLLQEQKSPIAAALAPRKTSDSRKIDLAVSLLQSDVDVGISAANDLAETAIAANDLAVTEVAPQEESGLGIELVHDARSVGGRAAVLSSSSCSTLNSAEILLSQSLSGASLSDIPTRAMDAPATKQDPPPLALRLESQDVALSSGSLSAQFSRPSGMQPSMGSSQSLASELSARGGLARRRGLFSPSFPANLVVSLAAATWLALWPAFTLTQSWLSERSHVSLQELKQSVQAPQVANKTPEGLSAAILAQAKEGEARFLWTWALIALVGTAVLVLPYRRSA